MLQIQTCASLFCVATLPSFDQVRRRSLSGMFPDPRLIQSRANKQYSPARLNADLR